MKIKISVFLLVISLFTACIEEYSPKIDGYKDILVIDGVITNEPGPYIIRLSRTLAVDDLDYLPLSGANIIISDDLDVQEALIELKPGVYATNPSGIRGEVGRKYRITINIGDETYQSNFEELKQPYEIDSVYAKVEYRETLEGSFEGLQFYVSTETNINKYLLWTPVETYEYKSDLILNYIFWKNWIDTIINPKLTTCWHTEKITEPFTFSTKNLTNPKINNFPLHYVNTSTKKLSEKYSLLVNQYLITEEAYRYWSAVKKQNAESASLYTTQPFQIKGNLINPNDQEDLILGYFMAAGISKKRVFIVRPLLNFNYTECKGDVEGLANIKHPPAPYPDYVTIVEIGGENEALGMALWSCFDCKEQGGIEEKPDFWED